MSNEVKAINNSGALIALVSAIGLTTLILVLDFGVRRLEKSLNSLPDRLVVSIRGAVRL